MLYLWSLILLCGDVESNPGPTNGNDADINIHSNFCKRSLVINCGFARVSIYDISSISRGHHRDTIIELFKHSNGLPSLMSSQDGKITSTTYFDVYSDHILDAIRKR